MTAIGKVEGQLIIPASLQRQAGIKPGDRVVFTVAPRSITITAAPAKSYKPGKAELAAIRRGEAAIARGEYVTLDDFLHEVAGPHRKPGAKTARKVSR